MKSLIKYIATFAALVSGLAVYAQNLETGTYEESNGIAYAKKAILNDDGTYTIDLETFVTGEVTQTFESVPVDVVLVLDVSGSMNDEISAAEYSRASVSSLTFNANAGETDYYYRYNNNYYRVSVGSASTGGFSPTTYYFLSFTTNNGNTRYIQTNGTSTNNRPNNVTSPRTNLLGSNTVLYTQSAAPVTKMDALKAAVKAFIEQIAHNDLYEDDTDDKPRSEPLGNQISIVKFATNSYYNSTTNATITPGNHFVTKTTYTNGQVTFTNYTTNSSSANANCTEVLSAFTPTSREANVISLSNDVDGIIAMGATSADMGMNLARLLINSLGEDRANSNKTVVFFTDGEPNHSNGFDNNVATTAIGYSGQIKAITYGSGEDATHPAVFSVGVFDSTPTTGGNLDNFMNYISSNYPNATAYNNGGTKASSDYYMDASGGSAEDLKAIFTAIAHAAGGTGNAEVSGGATLTVDVVSSSFSVPTGFANASDAVTVLVAPCHGITTIGGKEYLTFGDEKAPGEYGLPAITPTISTEDNKVSTTGFDYSGNWCGPDPTSTSAIHNYSYHGFKQIIRFVITVKDDAVGGPAVETNDPDSGIYLEGATEPLIKFNRPTVKLPVQIWIQKVGLQGEDSAVFTLARAPFTENFDPENATWENITKIVVGPKDYDPETGLYLKKQVGLDPDYYYRIKEDAWAFGYTYQLGGVKYTVGDNIENPFSFENTPKNKKFDEATARNIFNEKTSTQNQ